MFCKIIDNKIVNPSNFEGEREFNIDYTYYISCADGYLIYDEATDDIIVNPNFREEEKQKRIDKFNKEFFNTSLGYIRRNVKMKDGSTKDFLSDLLPTISIAVNMGQNVRILTYDEPDFDNPTPIEEYQQTKSVTTEFIQECFIQLSNDFKEI